MGQLHIIADWSINWFIDSETDRAIYWLTDKPVYWLINWLID